MFFLLVLLFSYTQLSQQIQNSIMEGREMSSPILCHVQGTLEVIMNQNVSLSCQSDSASPPVRYILFKGRQKVATLNRRDLTPAIFNLTINSDSYKPVSKPVLSSSSSQATKGQNVTLSCLSENGSLPITYIFLRGIKRISPPITKKKKEAAVFFLSINSPSDFGTYKCKARNNFPNNTKYSNSFNFTSAEERRNFQPLLISLGLIVLLLAIGFALAIPFVIIPSCKAKRNKPVRSSAGLISKSNAEETENYVIYTEIEHIKPEEQHANFTVIRKEDEKDKKRIPATFYSKVAITNGEQGKSRRSRFD